MTAESTARVARPEGRPGTVPLTVARVLMALLGAMTVAGATYFTFVASPEQGGVAGPVDWVIAAWALTMGVGFVVVAVALGRRSAGALRPALALVAAHVLFGIVKLIGYGETEVVVFLAVDAVILTLLAAGRRAVEAGR